MAFADDNETTVASAAASPSPFIERKVPAPSYAESQRHKFWDKKNTTAFAITGAIRAVDAAYTCSKMSNPYFRERWLPVKSCAGVSVWLAGTQATQLGVTYLAHRTGHHKWERWIPYVWTAPSAVGIGYTFTHTD